MQPMMNHVAWVTENQENCANFLVTYFDCQLGEKAVIEGEWADELAQMKGVKVHYLPAICPGTSTNIAVLKFIHPASEKNAQVSELNRMGFRHIGFLVEDIAVKTQQLESGGYKFFSPPVTAVGFQSQTNYFWGPEGVVIQLTQSMMAAPPPPDHHHGP